MAAIIAHFTRKNRERKNNAAGRITYSSAKCIHQLPPFDPCFDPQKHNRYLARLNRNGQNEDELQPRLQVVYLRKQSLKRYIVEAVIFGNEFQFFRISIQTSILVVLVLAVPALWIIIELTWPQQPEHYEHDKYQNR